ncbi:MAG: hypothetical protein LBC53_00445 [Spirochaetaceae bacterium]|jgi:hypothetical protein|nr:hypothetical protein [Spirochaetaceae bacterium]
MRSILQDLGDNQPGWRTSPINNFGIRHNNPRQKEDYDDPIFLIWMFHYFLATIHAWLLIIKRSKNNEK